MKSAKSPFTATNHTTSGGKYRCPTQSLASNSGQRISLGNVMVRRVAPKALIAAATA